MSHSLCYLVFFLCLHWLFIQSHKLELCKGPLCAEKTQMCNQRVQWCVTGCLPWYEARWQLSGDVWPLKHPTPRNMPSVKHAPALQSPCSCRSVAPNPSVIFTYLHTTHDSLVIFPIIPLQRTLNGWGVDRMWLSPAAKVCGLSGR